MLTYTLLELSVHKIR